LTTGARRRLETLNPGAKCLEATRSPSRGLGHVQRAIVAYFEAEPDNAFLLSELCERVYHGANRIEKKHRVAVARAAKAIKTLDHMKREALGGELVFYDPLNVLSYAMARKKSDLNSHRNHDPRRFPCLPCWNSHGRGNGNL